MYKVALKNGYAPDSTMYEVRVIVFFPYTVNLFPYLFRLRLLLKNKIFTCRPMRCLECVQGELYMLNLADCLDCFPFAR